VKVLRGILRTLGMAVATLSIVIGMRGFVPLNAASRYHASIDSEGGTFVYGMMSFMCLGGMFVGMLLGGTVWGVGIIGRVDSTRFQRIESRAQRIIVWSAAVPLVLLIVRLVSVWVGRNYPT